MSTVRTPTPRRRPRFPSLPEALLHFGTALYSRPFEQRCSPCWSSLPFTTALEMVDGTVDCRPNCSPERLQSLRDSKIHLPVRRAAASVDFKFLNFLNFSNFDACLCSESTPIFMSHLNLIIHCFFCRWNRSRTPMPLMPASCCRRREIRAADGRQRPQRVRLAGQNFAPEPPITRQMCKELELDSRSGERFDGFPRKSRV